MPTNTTGTVEYEMARQARLNYERQRQAQFDALANRVAANYDPNFNASSAAVPAAVAAPAAAVAPAAAAPGTTRVIHPPIAVGTAADGRPIVQRGGFLGTRNVPWAAATRHVGYDPYTGQVSVTTLTGEPSPYPHVLRGGPAPIGTYAIPALAQLAPLTQFHPGNIQSAPAKLKSGGGGPGGGKASSPPPSHPADPLIEDIARNGYRLRSGPAEYYKDSLHMNPLAEAENITELSRLPNGGVAGTRDDGSRYMNQDAMNALLYGGIDPTTGEAIPPSITGPAETYENGALHANTAAMAGAVQTGSQYPQTYGEPLVSSDGVTTTLQDWANVNIPDASSAPKIEEKTSPATPPSAASATTPLPASTAAPQTAPAAVPRFASDEVPPITANLEPRIQQLRQERVDKVLKTLSTSSILQNFMAPTKPLSIGQRANLRNQLRRLIGDSKTPDPQVWATVSQYCRSVGIDPTMLYISLGYIR